MKSTYQKLIISGNVGRDAEVRANPQGEYFATFSVAVRVGTKDKPKTDWVDVSCNGKLADIAKQFVRKGGKVLIEGFPSAHGFLQDGVVHAKLRITAQSIELLGGPHNDEDQEVSTAEDGVPEF